MSDNVGDTRKQLYLEWQGRDGKWNLSYRYNPEEINEAIRFLKFWTEQTPSTKWRLVETEVKIIRVVKG